MTATELGISQRELEAFCQQWKVNWLAVFGSAAEGKLRPASDIDLLVTFSPDAHWTMVDHYTMENELSVLFGREVDLVSVHAVEENPNPICRRQILDSARQIYAA